MHAVLEHVVVQISKEVRGLDADVAQQHPGGRTHEWNAQQVVEHLILTYRATSGLLESRLRKGRSSQHQNRTWLQRLLQVMILGCGRLPQGVPTLDENRPSPGEFAAMDGEQLGSALCAEMQWMDALLERCRHRFGTERVGNHPWLGPLRVDQWRRFHVVHGLHHVEQLRSILAQVAPEPVPIRITSGTLRKKLPIPVQRPLA